MEPLASYALPSALHPRPEYVATCYSPPPPPYAESKRKSLEDFAFPSRKKLRSPRTPSPSNDDPCPPLVCLSPPMTAPADPSAGQSSLGQDFPRVAPMPHPMPPCCPPCPPLTPTLPTWPRLPLPYWAFEPAPEPKLTSSWRRDTLDEPSTTTNQMRLDAIIQDLQIAPMQKAEHPPPGALEQELETLQALDPVQRAVSPPTPAHTKYPIGVLRREVFLNQSGNKSIQGGVDLRCMEPYAMLSGLSADGRRVWIRLSLDEYFALNSLEVMSLLQDASKRPSFTVGGISLTWQRDRLKIYRIGCEKVSLTYAPQTVKTWGFLREGLCSLIRELTELTPHVSNVYFGLVEYVVNEVRYRPIPCGYQARRDMVELVLHGEETPVTFGDRELDGAEAINHLLLHREVIVTGFSQLFEAVMNRLS